MSITSRNTRTMARQSAKDLLALARKHKVLFPKTWDEKHILEHCTAILNEHYNDEDGSYDEDIALEILLRSFGSSDGKTAADGHDGKAAGGKRKKPADGEELLTKRGTLKKSAIVAVEANRDIADALYEMAKIYLKHHNRKGSSYMMAAKSLRDCGHAIKDAKDADNLRGIGPAIADHVEEFLETGKIQRLEELRAGKV